MKELKTYQCEFCNSRYDTKEEALACESEHTMYNKLVKEFANVVKDTDLFYSLEDVYGILYIYKIAGVTINIYGEYVLIIKSLEIRLNRVFDWYLTRETYSFKMADFIDFVNTEHWKPMGVKERENLKKILKDKEETSDELLCDEVLTKYNKIRSKEPDKAVIFFNTLTVSRAELDAKIKYLIEETAIKKPKKKRKKINNGRQKY